MLEEVKTGKVLVDFWAPWCVPCQMMGRKIADELVPAHPGIKVVKINVDENPGAAAEFGVTSIPALFCYRDGVRLASFVGVTDVSEIVAAFAS